MRKKTVLFLCLLVFLTACASPVLIPTGTSVPSPLPPTKTLAAAPTFTITPEPPPTETAAPTGTPTPAVVKYTPDQLADMSREQKLTAAAEAISRIEPDSWWTIDKTEVSPDGHTVICRDETGQQRCAYNLATGETYAGVSQVKLADGSYLNVYLTNDPSITEHGMLKIYPGNDRANEEGALARAMETVLKLNWEARNGQLLSDWGRATTLGINRQQGFVDYYHREISGEIDGLLRAGALFEEDRNIPMDGGRIRLTQMPEVVVNYTYSMVFSRSLDKR